MNKLIIAFGVCAVLAIGALTASLGWLHRHDVQIQKLLTLQLQAQRRDMVRTKMEVCRAVYLKEGIAGLKSYLDSESAYDRNTTFIELLAPDKSVLLQAPADSKKVAIQSPINGSAAPEPLNLPSSGKKDKWTIGRTMLPDGKVLYVGLRYGESPQDG